MVATSILDRSSTTQWFRAQLADHKCTIRRAQPADMAAVKVLFGKLHAFNAALDSRFALSGEWETHFAVGIQKALRADEALCLIAREGDLGRACGFALAAVHRDSG